MASYFITGSSRGIGLAIVQLIASKPSSEISKVFASARSEIDSIKKLVSESNGRVEFVQLDVTSEESVKKAASHVEQSLNGKGLDVIINNAGILNVTPNGIETMTDLDETFKINVTGVHYVTSTFLPLLKKGNLKKVINISSTMGSLTQAAAGAYNFSPSPAYKVSKAALNMLTVQYALSFADEGFTFIAVSPGWVQTDLGGSIADLTVDQSAKAVTDIVFRVTKKDSGRFLNVRVPGWESVKGPNYYDGASPPW